MVERNIETTTLEVAEAGHQDFEITGRCDLRGVLGLAHDCRSDTTLTAFQWKVGVESLVACLGKRLKAVALPTVASSAMADMERELIRTTERSRRVGVNND